MTITKTFSTLEIINIIAFLNNNVKEEQMKELPTKFRWNLKKNTDKLMPIARRFEEFRDDLVKELQDIYFTDEKSYEYTETKRDDNGNPVLKSDGTEETTSMRKVKDEYMDEYNGAIKELNTKLQEILVEKNDVEINAMDLDNLVEMLPDDTSIDFDCLSILCFMDETTNVKKEDVEEAE